MHLVHVNRTSTMADPERFFPGEKARKRTWSQTVQLLFLEELALERGQLLNLDLRMLMGPGFSALMGFVSVFGGRRIL